MSKQSIFCEDERFDRVTDTGTRDETLDWYKCNMCLTVQDENDVSYPENNNDTERCYRCDSTVYPI
jgi:hypothetical protein